MPFTYTSNKKAVIFFPILWHSKTGALQTDYTQAPANLQWVIPWCKIRNDVTGTFDDLQAGVNARAGDTSSWMNANCHGIELSLWYQLAQHSGRTVYFYKQTRGNTTMSNDHTRQDRDPSDNELYPQLINGIAQCIGWFQANNTPFLRDYTYINIGDVDAYDAILAWAYLAKRRQLIANIRAVFLKPQMVDIFPSINTDLINSGIFPYTNDILSDQITLGSDPKTIRLDTEHIPLNIDHIHWWTSAILTHSDDVFNEVKVSY